MVKGVFYLLPKQNLQRGVTCWYYAFKMLLRFHDIIPFRLEQTHDDPGEPSEHGTEIRTGFRKLRPVRKAVTGTGNSRDKDVVVKYLLNDVMHDTPLFSDAIELLNKVGSMERYSLFAEAIGSGRIRPITIADFFDLGIEKIVDLLEKNGPLFISVDRSPNRLDYKEVDHGGFPLFGSCVRMCNFSGGAHAMVIYGAHADTGFVYLWNPVNDTYIYFANWADVYDVLIEAASYDAFERYNGSKETVIALTVNCSPIGRCSHMQNRWLIP